MNTKIKNFIATLLLAVPLSFVLPWWSVMLAAFIASVLFPLEKGVTFFTPFCAILLFWGVHAFLLSSANDFVLAKKIATLLNLGGSPYLLIIATGTIGGLAAGISAMLGKELLAFMKN